MVRLIAFGLLYLLAFEVLSFARAWHSGVQRFTEVRNLIAISPATAHQQLCSRLSADSGQRRLCKVEALYRATPSKLASLCNAPSSKLGRLRRFRVQLSCSFPWIRWGRAAPMIAADTYRISVQQR